MGNLWVAMFCAGVILIMAAPDLILGTRRDIKISILVLYRLCICHHFLSGSRQRRGGSGG